MTQINKTNRLINTKNRQVAIGEGNGKMSEISEGEKIRLFDILIWVMVI